MTTHDPREFEIRPEQPEQHHRLPILRGPKAGTYVDDNGFGTVLEIRTTPPVSAVISASTRDDADPGQQTTRYLLRTCLSTDAGRWAYYWLPERDTPESLTLAELDQLAGYAARCGRPVPPEQFVAALDSVQTARARAHFREARR